MKKLIIAHLNINSLRNKFEFLVDQIKGKVDLLMVSETKLDENFPQGQFKISGFSRPFKLDRNSNGGGIILFVREDIPAKLIFTEVSPTEGFYVEINLRKQKWLICCSYNPSKHNTSKHIEALSKSIDLFSSNYENLLLMGDFNAVVDNAVLKDFCNLYNLTNLINKATGNKNPNNPSCIDLLLKNFLKYFQNSSVIETGLFDFNKMVVTVMKTNFRKLEPKIINYRNYRYFSNDRFREKVTSELSKVVLENSGKGFNKFLVVRKEALNMYALLEKKYIRGNNSPFMNRALSKEIMKKSRLRNKFLKGKSEDDKKNYVKQRNYLPLLRRTKKEYYGNLDPKKIPGNRTFWRTVKPFLSNKSIENEKIILVEKEEILTKDNSVAKVLNNFFSNIVKTLGINSHPLVKEVNDPTLTAILKYRNHPSVLTILDKYKNNSIFTFSHVTKDEVLKEIGNLDTTKSS